MEEIHIGLFIYTVSAKIIVDQCSHHGGDRSSIITVSAKSKEKTVLKMTNVLPVEKTDIASIVYFRYQEHREDKIVVYMIMVPS